MKSQGYEQLPSQPILNVRGNVNVVMLSRKELKDPVSPTNQAPNSKINTR